MKTQRQQPLFDIIFEGKNKSDEAYNLRESYPRTLTKALILGLYIFAWILFLPLIIMANTMKANESTNLIIICRWDNTIQKLPPKPKICVGTMPNLLRKFIAPTIKPDEEVCDIYIPQTCKANKLVEEVTTVCPISMPKIDSSNLEVELPIPPILNDTAKIMRDSLIIH